MAEHEPSKILAIEYQGQHYPPSREELGRLAADPMIDAPNIIVTFEEANEPNGVLRIRPYRFCSTEFVIDPETGVAKIY